MMKQVEDAKSFAIQGFCKDLLDVSRRNAWLPINKYSKALTNKVNNLSWGQHQSILTFDVRKTKKFI
jgi:hypothetical protein